MAPRGGAGDKSAWERSPSSGCNFPICRRLEASASLKGAHYSTKFFFGTSRRSKWSRNFRDPRRKWPILGRSFERDVHLLLLARGFRRWLRSGSGRPRPTFDRHEPNGRKTRRARRKFAAAKKFKVNFELSDFSSLKRWSLDKLSPLASR